MYSRQVAPQAIYVHCYAHCLNLVLCGWIPTRTDNFLPCPYVPSNKVFTREQGPDNYKGPRTTRQGSDLIDTESSVSQIFLVEKRAG